MGTKETASVESGGNDLSGDVVGGLILTAIGVIHVFGLGVGGALGFTLLLIVWPLIAGALASRVERGRPDGRDWGTTSAVAGAFGALATTLIVFLAGLAGLWFGFLTTAFGSDFWAVVFAVLIVVTISWTVFGYVGGFVETRIGGTDPA